MLNTFFLSFSPPSRKVMTSQITLMSLLDSLTKMCYLRIRDFKH